MKVERQSQENGKNRTSNSMSFAKSCSGPVMLMSTFMLGRRSELNFSDYNKTNGLS